MHPRLGASWDGGGTTFVVRSESAAGVDLCLDGAQPLPMEPRGGHRWMVRVPGAGPGTCYGFRAHGPGLDPTRLLLDPYALQVVGGLSLHALAPGVDSAPHVPRSVVVDPSYDWRGDTRPSTAWADSVVYELHVEGFTAQHPDVPEHLRGTYAGLAHPAALAHLTGLGVTAVELLPVHAFLSEPHLLRRGLVNHWGYNSVGFFAPHAGYAATRDPVREFRDMVRALHAAGLQVLLDVVYNHTGEGDAHGPTLCWRGWDDETSYRHHDDGSYDDVTGCGGTFDLRSPHVLRTVMDSLRHWVTEMHVDGFRFDLAPALTRGSAFLDAVGQDPVLRDVVLIAEPWDLGPDGYRLGRFPEPWAEWNADYRDAVRDAWRGTGDVRALGRGLSGSSDLFQRAGRRPSASVNLVTAHDGFTLRDLTTYDRKRNAANGEDGRDGEDHNRSWNCGVEGETDDPEVNALRLRQAANLLATLLLSAGVPMLTMGDEVRRTQGGNNNGYCLPFPMPWGWDADAQWLHDLTRQLLQLRARHPSLRRPDFATGLPSAEGVRDLAWFGAHGMELTAEQWDDPGLRTLLVLLSGQLLLVLHTAGDDGVLALPPGRYDVLLDTAQGGRGRVQDRLRVAGRSVQVLEALG